MLPETVIRQRLYNQRLEGAKFQTPAEVVSWLGAVQAQEYALAKWALGLRMQSASDNLIEQAFNTGQILRTHLMRPTWHFVTPNDIRWLLELTAPRVHQVNGTMYRKLELDETLLRYSSEIIESALEGGRQWTRAEIAAVLTKKGINVDDGMRLGYIVHYAELEGIVCSGARRGKQHTYALLSERAPQARKLSREEALAELTLRFFSSHGPATVKDFAWWSGLTVADVKAGLAILGSKVKSEVVEGETYWLVDALNVTGEITSKGHLLPVYDEYTIAYKHHSAPLDPEYTPLAEDRFFTSAFIYDGRIIGMWRRTFSKKSVVIEVAPFRPFTTDEREAFAAAGERFRKFLSMPVSLV
jgi:hypothetical protein